MQGKKIPVREIKPIGHIVIQRPALDSGSGTRSIMMEHFWQDDKFEDKWFTYPGLYAHFAELLNDGDHFVEIGAWKGASISCLAVELINQNKMGVKVDTVDTWEGSPNEHDNDSWVLSGKLYEKFLENIQPVRHMINPVRKTSVDASKDYDDESIDIVFIDGLHTYEGVKQDIECWLPKVKPQGIIAGHDWRIIEDVTKAVVDSFGIFKVMEVSGQCWLVYKKDL